MDMDMNSMAGAIGVSVPVLRFLLCFVATIPVSFFGRFVPSKLPKHLYSAGTGALLSYLSFGFSSNLHFLVPMLLGYASMILSRHRCGIITFSLGFAYLISWYVNGFHSDIVSNFSHSLSIHWSLICSHQNWLYWMFEFIEQFHACRVICP